MFCSYQGRSQIKIFVVGEMKIFYFSWSKIFGVKGKGTKRILGVGMMRWPFLESIQKFSQNKTFHNYKN